MYTRQQYLNNECTHREYYAQLCNDVKGVVKARIGIPVLLASTDPHLNDIPLSRWDGIAMSSGIHYGFKELGDVPTLAGKVCAAKEAARQLIEEHNQTN